MKSHKKFLLLWLLLMAVLLAGSLLTATPGEKAETIQITMRDVERQVLGILNRLIHDPQLITASIPNIADSPIFQRQRRELDDLLRSPPVDEEQAKSSALALASFMLTCIGPEEYETCRLQLLFQCRQPMRELDAELLRQSVRKITYGDRIVKILLKNNQWMEGGTQA